VRGERLRYVLQISTSPHAKFLDVTGSATLTLRASHVSTAKLV